MRHRRTLAQSVLQLVASIGLTGCAVSDPTQYYTLGQAARSAGSGESASIASTPPVSPNATGALSIGVGPVIVPGYLRRDQIVTRAEGDEVKLAMFHRWAEPLEDGIARIVGEQIAGRVPTERIAMFPWRGQIARALHYQVVVAVMRFDGRQGGDVTLDTRWRILGNDGTELAFRRSTMTDAAAGPGVEPLIAAMTRTIAALGQEIAAEIRAIPR